MKRVNFNNFEQLTKEDLNNIGIFELSTNTLNILKEHISGGSAVLTDGMTIVHVSANTLRIAVGKGISASGDFLINDNANFELLATNSQHDVSGGDGVPADVTDGNYFIVEIQFEEINGVIELRNFIDPNGNTFSQTVVKEKLVAIKSRIKEGNATTAPAVESGWTKIAEIKKIASGNYTLYNVDSYFNKADSEYYNTGWTIEKQITTLNRSVINHRNNTIIDHPHKSVTESHLAQALQDKINASVDVVENDFEYDEKLNGNLLNKAPGEARNNKSAEYFFGTGIDTDYFEVKQLADIYKDNLDNDDTDATTVDDYDVNNPSSQQTITNLVCDISTSLFDIWLDATKVMTAINNDYDWTVEINTINDGLISLRPQTTWGAFKSGNDSADAADKKLVRANDGIDGLEQGGSFVHVELLYQKTAFDAHFQGTSLYIVITKDGQVYKWDGTGNPSNALTADNYVFGYEMLLQPSEDGGSTAKSGTTPGQNDAGWEYRKIATKKHRVYTPESFKLFIGRHTTDCVGSSGDKYYDEFGSKAFQLKTEVIMLDGFTLEGIGRFLSIIKYDETETEWANWACFRTIKKYKLACAFDTSNPVQITYSNHGMVDGDYVIGENTSAAGEVANGRYVITKIDADTFSLAINNGAGSGGTIDIIQILWKNIKIGRGLSLISPSATTDPIQVPGLLNSLIDIFDIEKATTYAVDGEDYTQNIKVHERTVCDGMDLNELYGKGLDEYI